jgi:hypothetical protein
MERMMRSRLCNVDNAHSVLANALGFRARRRRGKTAALAKQARSCPRGARAFGLKSWLKLLQPLMSAIG